MSASAIPPNNILMLALLGGGAYWFITRRAHAAPGGYSTPAGIPSQGISNPYVGIAGAIAGMFAKSPSIGTVDGRSASQWDVTPAGVDGPRFNNPSAYVSSAVDGMAYNPPTQAPWDASAYSSAGGDTYYGAGSNWGV